MGSGSGTNAAVVGVTLHGIAVAVVQAVLGVALVVAGGTKLADEELHVDQFEHFGYPQWFRQATGAMEVLAALALLAGIVAPTPLVALGGGVLAAAVMLGALATHARIGDGIADMRGPFVLLALALVVVAVQASFLLG